MSTMNTMDRDNMLAGLVPGEQLECKVWAVIMALPGEIFTLSLITPSPLAGGAGALSNVYCYMGIANQKLVIATINTFGATRQTDGIIIPFSDISEVKIRPGFLPGRKVLKIKLTNGSKMKISTMTSAIGTDIKDQKENIEKLFSLLPQN